MGIKGIAYIFTNEDDEIVLYHSPLFDGDMDIEVYGIEFLERLQIVKRTSDFIHQMREFNEGHFDYDEEMMYKARNQKETPQFYWYTKANSIHFKLFERNLPIEDYSYIKNISNQSIIVECKNKIILLKPSQILICNEGNMITIGEEFHLEKLEILNYSEYQPQKKPYTIKIKETRVYEMTVEAENEDEATQIAEGQFSYGNYDKELLNEKEIYFETAEN